MAGNFSQFGPHIIDVKFMRIGKSDDIILNHCQLFYLIHFKVVMSNEILLSVCILMHTTDIFYNFCNLGKKIKHDF